MQQHGLNRDHKSRNKPSKIFPEVRVPLTPVEMGSVTSSPFPGRKRRRLNDYLWADGNNDDDEGDHIITREEDHYQRKIKNAHI